MTTYYICIHSPAILHELISIFVEELPVVPPVVVTGLGQVRGQHQQRHQ